MIGLDKRWNLLFVVHMEGDRDRIDFVVDSDRVYLKPANVDVRQLSGFLHKPGRQTVSLEDMKEDISACACESAESVKTTCT